MDLLSLKWKNHGLTFLRAVTSLRAKETYTDVTLACQGRYLPAHKLVLATCSDYFAEVFERTICKAPVVIIHGIDVNHLQYLLDYMYLGEVDVPQAELASLIKAAEGLMIKGLAVPDEEPAPPSKKRSHNPESESESKKSRTSSPQPEQQIQKQDEIGPDHRFLNKNDEPPLALPEQHQLLPKMVKIEKKEPPLASPERDRQNRDISDFYSFKEEEITYHEEPDPGQSYGQLLYDPQSHIVDPMAVSWDERSIKTKDSSDRTQQSDLIAVSWDERSIKTKDSSDRTQQSDIAHQVHGSHDGSPLMIPAPRLYPCTFCQRPFKGKSDLKRHVLTHTGEKPFQCRVCLKSFSLRANLQRHMSTHFNWLN